MRSHTLDNASPKVVMIGVDGVEARGLQPYGVDTSIIVRRQDRTEPSTTKSVVVMMDARAGQNRSILVPGANAWRYLASTDVRTGGRARSAKPCSCFPVFIRSIQRLIAPDPARNRGAFVCTS
ncbi:hypothetical protein E4T47_02170 [Aureobasidium subglaciale]|nr:hypothetical protein E4T47_02170 [Aureobasidium subglaciale]